MTLKDRIEALWTGAKAAPAKTRAHLDIPADRVDGGASLGPDFGAKRHYFRVYVSEMFLAHARDWFVSYDPMAFVATNYLYGREDVTSAFVVGPSMLQGYGQPVPQGTIFRDTPVTGLHPYQGGSVAVTVLLSRVQRRNNAQQLLGTLESVSAALDPSTAFTAYVKLGGAILDGVQSLLGLAETVPVLGYRVTRDPDTQLPLRPGYYAILDADEAEVDADRFSVRDSRLLMDDAPYRESDFVLFSIRQASSRSDEGRLSFFPLWETAQDLAAQPGPHFWHEAKANFNALKRAMLTSPDLTRPDYDRLREFYLGELVKRRDEVVMESDLDEAADILDDDEASLEGIAQRLEQVE